MLKKSSIARQVIGPLFFAAILLLQAPWAWAEDPVVAPSATPPKASTALQLTGSARVRYEGDDHTDFSSERDFGAIRVRANFDWQVDPRLKVFFQPEFAKFLGNSEFVGSSATANALTATSGNNSYDSSLGAHQGYIDYRPTAGLDLIAGRQVLSYGDDVVIGKSDWTNVGRSFDAARARLALFGGNSDLFASKLVDTNVSGNGPGDQNLYGWYNSFAFGRGFDAVDFYVLTQSLSSTVSAPAQTTYVGGLRLKASLERWYYRFEFTREAGNAVRDGVGAYQAVANLGVITLSDYGIRLGLEGFKAGPGYNQLFPSAHGQLGLADLFGRQNIAGFAVRTSARPAELWELGLDFWKFNRVDSASSPVNTKGTALYKTNAGSSSELATEWDAQLKYHATPNLTISGGGALVDAWQYLIDQGAPRSISFYYLQLETTF